MGLLTLLHNAPNVTMSFSIIEGAELRRRLVETGVGSEDTTATFSLIANNSTHVGGGGRLMLSSRKFRSGLENGSVGSNSGLSEKRLRHVSTRDVIHFASASTFKNLVRIL